MGYIWSIKVILYGFELASSLSVHFHKIKIMGFNVDSNFLLVIYEFLSCAIISFPFTFLGLPIGVNPHIPASWNVILSKLHSKLASWKRKKVSLRGRVTLLNSILSSILQFYLSFYKAPKSIIQEIVSTGE